MRVTALYNPEAGTKSVTRRRLASVVEEAGYRATYVSAKGKRWKDALDDPGDLVIVAGGDGTIAKVVRRLAGRGIPVAIVPSGTANNIARSLGVAGSLEKIVARWASAVPTPLDLGAANGPWGDELFVEAWGLGVFPRMLEMAAAREKMSPAQQRRTPSKHGIPLMIDLVMSSPATPWRVTLDGQDLSGEYVMLETMNIRYVGGGMELAPKADTSDGALDVIAVREGERMSFVEYLHEVQRGMERGREFTRRARRVEVECAETVVHIDDEAWAGRTNEAVAECRAITVTVEAGAIEVLL